MRRSSFLLAAVVALLAVGKTTNTAQAGWHDFWNRVHVDFHRMNCWPKPFSCPDQQLTRAPLEIMKNNGWRMQNTIRNELFQKENNQLTQAGKIKVHWIVTQTPEPRRTVFVLRGPTAEATAARVDSVQKVVAAAVVEGPMPEVMVTHIIPRGGSGTYYHSVNMGYEQSIPAPRLPDAGGGGDN